MLFKTAFDQQSTIQKRSAKMMRSLESSVCGIRPSERVKYQYQMRQCFGFCSCPVVTCTLGRNGLSCLLWLCLLVPRVPFTASLHLFPAHLDCSQTVLSPSLAAIVQSCLSRYSDFFSYSFLVLIREPPFLLILARNTAVRKRSECLSAKDVKNHET